MAAPSPEYGRKGFTFSPDTIQQTTPTAKDFVRKYDLGSGPGVLGALEYLLKRELVCKYVDSEGIAYHEIYDLILMRWLQKK